MPAACRLCLGGNARTAATATEAAYCMCVGNELPNNEQKIMLTVTRKVVNNKDKQPFSSI